MRKFVLSIAALLCIHFSATAQAPGEDNGMGLKLHAGIPNGSYGIPGTIRVEEKGLRGSEEFELSGTQFGITLDHRWYLWHNNHNGIAINAHWLDMGSTFGEMELKRKETRPMGYEYEETGQASMDVTVLEAGFLGVGPIYTFYPGLGFSVDAYYNIVPTAMFTLYEENDLDDMSYGGFGFTHNLGVAFRWLIFQGGVEYRFGKIEMECLTDFADDFDQYYSDDSRYSFGYDDKFTYKSNMENLRFFLGLKF